MGMIGVDIGRSAHYAVGLDDDGKRLIARAVANRQRDIDDLVSWAAKHDACVVVDQPNGGAAALIQTCWDRGVPVGYLHGVGDGACEGLHEGEAKTDPKDAFVIADVARTHPSRIVALSPILEERARLELLCGRDEDLRAEIVTNPGTLAGGDNTIPICGNDAGAKGKATALLESFGWKDVLDLGDITRWKPM